MLGRSLFSKSLIDECVQNFMLYLQGGRCADKLTKSTPAYPALDEAIMYWLFDDTAFGVVGDDYELFIRVVLAIWLYAVRDGTDFWFQDGDERRQVNVTVGEASDAIWLSPEYFRNVHYEHVHKVQ